VVNTVMQVGSAVGIAVVGVVFFGLVEAAAPGEPPAIILTAAIQQTLWFQVLAFGTAGALSFLLPRHVAAPAEVGAEDAEPAGAVVA
jgi:hypothetical protein